MKTWKTEKPSEPGWYWWWRDRRNKRKTVVEIYYSYAGSPTDKLKLVFLDGISCEPLILEEQRGWFLGPIFPEPQEAE